MKKLSISILGLFIAALSFAQPCGNLFISEYVEGSSFNKAFEIYNPTSNTVDLSNYRVIVRGFSSSGTTPFFDTLTLAGNLAAGDVYVVANSQSDAAILAEKDTTDNNVANFNGNDAVGLFDLNLGQMIDVVGDYTGTNVGATGWPVDTGFTRENTLVRLPGVNQGTTSWATGQNQWLVYPQNDFSYLGSHTMTPCAPITDTLVSFTAVSANVSEDPGPATYTINLNLNVVTNPSVFNVDVVLVDGDATQAGNYTTQTATFNMTSTAQVSVTITDDALQEDADTLTFKLRNPTGNLQLGDDSTLTLIILPSDQPLPTLPLYSIATVRGTNGDGQPDSLNVDCRVTGTVLGVNVNPGGLSFFIHDGTAGMGVFSPSSAGNNGYTVNEGDSIVVQGSVTVFRGLGQMGFLDTILLVGNGTVPTPTVVTNLDESTEGEYIRINNVTITDQFSGGGGVTYDISDGNNTYEMYVDNDVNVTIPTSGTFDVIGIGSQFASTTTPPFTDGYLISVQDASGIVLGITELTADDVQVYPNPTTDKVVINTVVTGLEQVQLMDVTVRVVMTQNITSSREVINIGGIEPGMYILQVTGANQVFSTRIIKM